MGLGGFTLFKLRRGRKAELGPKLMDPEKAVGPVRKVQVHRGRVVSWMPADRHTAASIRRSHTPRTIDSRRTSTTSLPRTIDLDADFRALQESFRFNQDGKPPQQVVYACSESSGPSSPIEPQTPISIYRPRTLGSIDESVDPADKIKELSWATYNAHRPSNDALSSVMGSITPPFDETRSQYLPMTPRSSFGRTMSDARRGSASTSSTSASRRKSSAHSAALRRGRSQPCLDANAKAKMNLGLHPLITSNLYQPSEPSPLSAGGESADAVSPTYAPSIQSAIYKSPVHHIIPAAPQPRKPSKLDLRGSFSRANYDIPSPATVSSIASPSTPGATSVFSDQATLGVTTPRPDRNSTASPQLRPNEFLDVDSSTARSRSRSSLSSSVSSRSTSHSRKPRGHSSLHHIRKRPAHLAVNTTANRAPANDFRLEAAGQDSGLYTGVFPSPPPSNPGSPTSATLTALPKMPESIESSPAFATTPTFRVPLYSGQTADAPKIKSLEKLKDGSNAPELSRRGSDGDVVQKSKKAVKELEKPSMLRAFSAVTTPPKAGWPPTEITTMLVEAHGMAQSTTPITPKSRTSSKAASVSPTQPKPKPRNTRSKSADGADEDAGAKSADSKPASKHRSGKNLLRTFSSGVLVPEARSGSLAEGVAKTRLRPALKVDAHAFDMKALPRRPTTSTTPPGAQRVEVNALRVENPDVSDDHNSRALQTKTSRTQLKSSSVALRSSNADSPAEDVDQAKTGSGRDTLGPIKAAHLRASGYHRRGLEVIAGAVAAGKIRGPTVTSRELRGSLGSSDEEALSPEVSTMSSTLFQVRESEELGRTRKWDSPGNVSPLSTDFPAYVRA